MTRAQKQDMRRRFKSNPLPSIESRPGARFYVTIRRSGQTGFLLGPYASHMTALANVERARRMARTARPDQTAFAAFGTASRPDSVKTVFGR